MKPLLWNSAEINAYLAHFNLLEPLELWCNYGLRPSQPPVQKNSFNQQLARSLPLTVPTMLCL